MAAALGEFDMDLVPETEFDPDMSVLGWFDHDLIDTAGGGGGGSTMPPLSYYFIRRRVA